MMNRILTLYLLLFMAGASACSNNLLEYHTGNMSIEIEKGAHYLHDFPLFMGIKIKNAPQMAIWMEDAEGNYLSTLFVTGRIASQSWRSAGGNRRKEALPHWCYSRGVQYEDGLYLPTKKQPLTDGVSSATPRKSFKVNFDPQSEMKRFIIKIEVNHSTDFNEHYPKDAGEGANNYSGGKMGSGQPSLIYVSEVDLTGGQREFTATLKGHGSPDGSDGEVHTDVSGITSALDILKSITIFIKD